MTHLDPKQKITITYGGPCPHCGGHLDLPEGWEPPLGEVLAYSFEADGGTTYLQPEDVTIIRRGPRRDTAWDEDKFRIRIGEEGQRP